MLQRLAALEALSAIRDPDSVLCLSALCASEDRQLSVPAHRTLVAITGQDFGTALRRWSTWHDTHKEQHRAQWLIEGLLHSDERMRAIAGHELQKLTQVYYGFAAGAPKRERERAHARYEAWWLVEGRAMFRP